MYNSAKYINTFDKDSYRNINEIHEELEKVRGEENPDPQKIQDLYLRELNESLFLGGRLTRDYGMGKPF